MKHKVYIVAIQNCSEYSGKIISNMNYCLTQYLFIHKINCSCATPFYSTVKSKRTSPLRVALCLCERGMRGVLHCFPFLAKSPSSDYAYNRINSNE